jgi:hypothetical protein
LSLEHFQYTVSESSIWPNIAAAATPFQPAGFLFEGSSVDAALRSLVRGWFGWSEVFPHHDEGHRERLGCVSVKNKFGCCRIDHPRTENAEDSAHYGRKIIALTGT